jgi:hypothetical protein
MGGVYPPGPVDFFIFVLLLAFIIWLVIYWRRSTRVTYRRRWPYDDY